MPVLELKSLRIAIASADCTIEREELTEGFSFRAHFTLFGADILVVLKVSLAGIVARFSSTRIDFIPGLKLCKNDKCAKSEGISSFGGNWEVIIGRSS